MTPNLWWVFDSEDQSFSTLPTGPFLAPALIIALAIALYRSIAVKEQTFTTIAGYMAETEHWQQHKKRYDELVHKFVYKELSYTEGHELNKLEKYLLNPWNIKRSSR